MGKLERKEEKKKKKNILGVSHFWFVVGNEGEFILLFFFFLFSKRRSYGLDEIIWGKRREKDERTIKKIFFLKYSSSLHNQFNVNRMSFSPMYSNSAE